MAIVTETMFNNYILNFDTDTSGLKALYRGAAQQVVESYIGYPIEKTLYDYTIYGFNGNVIPCKAWPIDGTSVDIKIDTTALTVLYTDKNYIYLDESYTDQDIIVKYNAGYETTYPDDLTLAVLRIATMMYMESEKRIGLSGTASVDGIGATTYINYTSYQKYLSPISKYRIVKS